MLFRPCRTFLPQPCVKAFFGFDALIPKNARLRDDRGTGPVCQLERVLFTTALAGSSTPRAGSDRLIENIESQNSLPAMHGSDAGFEVPGWLAK